MSYELSSASSGVGKV